MMHVLTTSVLNTLRTHINAMDAHHMGKTAALAAVLCLASNGQAQTVNISGACNIYGAGHVSPPQNCGSGPGPGVLPARIDILPGTISVEFTNVSGTFSFCSSGCASGADGQAFGTTTFDSLAGISGLTTTRVRDLHGVFLSDAEPLDPPPASLNYTDFSFTQSSPLIAQQFFIGDGLTGTGTGTVQRFTVPAGATRLFLGFADGLVPCIGWYSDNSGSLSATIVMNVCAADFNTDGALDFFDYLDFVAALASSAPAADFNHDAIIDFSDYLDFVDAFSLGC